MVTNYFVKEVDALQLAIFQLGFATLYATIGTFIFETRVLPTWHDSLDPLYLV
ncbi:hypothetical protein [Peribacillus simplex]|uniref:hypothetical protein n=1 Tax=Peribacillus simplex TaxID=1478 RepID=UPI00367278F1